MICNDIYKIYVYFKYGYIYLVFMNESDGGDWIFSFSLGCYVVVCVFSVIGYECMDGDVFFNFYELLIF